MANGNGETATEERLQNGGNQALDATNFTDFVIELSKNAVV